MITVRAGLLGILLLLGAIFSYSIQALPEHDVVKSTHILNPRLFGPRELLASLEPHPVVSHRLRELGV